MLIATIVILLVVCAASAAAVGCSKRAEKSHADGKPDDIWAMGIVLAGFGLVLAALPIAFTVWP